jgi:hypothetical protein
MKISGDHHTEESTKDTLKKCHDIHFWYHILNDTCVTPASCLHSHQFDTIHVRKQQVIRHAICTKFCDNQMNCNLLQRDTLHLKR